MRAVMLALSIIAVVSAASTSIAGTLADATFHSKALNADLPVNIYRPDGDPPENGWPVIYLLHGHDGDQNSWRDLGNIQKTLDGMIASGMIRPVVVVMPGVKNSWYVDSADVGGPGNYETTLTGDLRVHMEKTLPVRKDRQGRAIIGLSMGGFGALHLAYAHEDLYAAVASLSGAIWQNVPATDLDKSPAELKLIQDSAFFHRLDRTTITSGIVLPSTGDHFSGSFGTPFDARRFNEQNIFTTVAQHVVKKQDLPATYLTVGDDDGFSLWRGAIALHETLQADNRKSELRITDGDHVWDVWKVSIIDALKFVDGEWEWKSRR
nr:alpha/beta hydrolase family protein [Agrobacterium sp. rho-8.1]